LEWVLLSYKPFYGELIGENDPFHKKASHEMTAIYFHKTCGGSLLLANLYGAKKIK